MELTKIKSKANITYTAISTLETLGFFHIKSTLDQLYKRTNYGSPNTQQIQK